MKLLFTFILLLLSLQIFPKEWNWLNPKPQGNRIDKICNKGNTYWGISGQLIMKSTDYGKSWQFIYSGDAWLEDISFGDENTGFAVGYIFIGTTVYPVILKTTDGGNTWTRRTDQGSGQLWSCSFINADTGWVVNLSESVFKTTDGGNTWAQTVIPYSPEKIWFVDANLGFICALLSNGPGNDYYFMRTSDGGSTWSAYIFQEFYKINFPVPDTGYMLTYGGFNRTTDKGITWSSYINTPSLNAEAVTKNIMFSAKDSLIYKSTDAGITWQIKFVLPQGQWTDILSFTDVNNGIIEGPFGLSMSTSDCGESWQVHSSNLTQRHDIQSIHFSDLLHGWAVGYAWENGHGSPLIMSTSDGGDTWTKHNSPPLPVPLSVWFLDQNNGWIGGEGTIYKTTDGGLNWGAGTGTGGFLPRKMIFFDSLTGYAFGFSTSGFYPMFVTTDGGVTWNQRGPSHGVFHNYSFLNKNLGWIAGRGYIKKTTDGGFTWVNQNPYGDEFYSGIVFKDSSIGLVTRRGYMMKTRDGGNTWENLSLKFYTDADLKVSDNGNVHLSFMLAKSTDDGDTWIFENYKLSSGMTTLCFVGNVGWAAGGWGTIMRYGDVITPVQLISFNSVVSGKDILLAWETSTEINNLGFSVERSIDKVHWREIIFINSSANHTGNKYLYNDKNLTEGIYYYRLKQVDYNGSIKYSEITEADLLSHNYSLKQNYPNPFNPLTMIEYSVAERANITLKIFNILGQEISIIVNALKEPGNYKVMFDGSSLAGGVYYYRINTDSYTQTKKMILLK